MPPTDSECSFVTQKRKSYAENGYLNPYQKGSFVYVLTYTVREKLGAQSSLLCYDQFLLFRKCYQSCRKHLYIDVYKCFNFSREKKAVK